LEVGDFDFDQLSLNLPHCAAAQTDIEARYAGHDSTLKPFNMLPAFWHTTVIHEN